ncbi:hypothetical protein MMC28_002099 [Mycoblastus sanguinarius]|nr:hypothetical protein [Mycoblastus sanguinarius]
MPLKEFMPVTKIRKEVKGKGTHARKLQKQCLLCQAEEGLKKSTIHFCLFKHLPPELILEIMCHTPSCDLFNLIMTAKFVNDIWTSAKKMTFKRMQMYQFSEFEGIFGDMPSLGGIALEFQSISKTNVFQFNSPRRLKRCQKQIQRFEEAVRAFDWRRYTGAATQKMDADIMLNRLGRDGGWIYLEFLDHLQKHVDEEVNIFYSILEKQRTKPLNFDPMAAKVAMLTLCRMHWRSPPFQQYSIDDSEAARVKVCCRVSDQLEIFSEQTTHLQDMVREILRSVMKVMRERLRLTQGAKTWIEKYCKARVSRQAALLDDDGLCHKVELLMTGLLLEKIFFHGIPLFLRHCESSGDAYFTVFEASFTCKLSTALEFYELVEFSDLAIRRLPWILVGLLLAEGLDLGES